MNKDMFKIRGGSPSPDFTEKTKKVTSRKRAGVIMCLCLLLVAALLLSPVFSVKQIYVFGTDRTDSETIIKASGIAYGASIFRLSPSKCEERISKMAFVDSVDVKRKFPSTVEISITESKEVAYIHFIGNYVGIDESGKILEIKQKGEEISLPVIVGMNLTEFGIGNYIKTDNPDKQDVVFKILKQVGTNEIGNMLRTIDVSDLNDIRFFTSSEATVLVGTMDDIIYKVSFLKKILEDPADKRGAVIDMTDTEKVTYRGSR